MKEFSVLSCSSMFLAQIFNKFFQMFDPFFGGNTPIFISNITIVNVMEKPLKSFTKIFCCIYYH